MAIVKAAQASMNEVPEFAGLVRSIPTDIYWDKKADEAYPSWRKNFEEWKKLGLIIRITTWAAPFSFPGLAGPWRDSLSI